MGAITAATLGNVTVHRTVLGGIDSAGGAISGTVGKIAADLSNQLPHNEPATYWESAHNVSRMVTGASHGATNTGLPNHMGSSGQILG